MSADAQAAARRYGPAAIEDDARRFFSLTWTLATEDAHGLYRRFGFTQPNPRLMERRGQR